MIFASQDLEESIIAPISIPWVGNEPIWCVSLYTPTEDSNSMSAKFFAHNMFVNTWKKYIVMALICRYTKSCNSRHTFLVVDEVFVDCKSSLNGSIFHYLLLNCLCISCNRICLFAEMFIFGIWDFVSCLANVLAFWCFTVLTFAWWPIASCVMFAWCNSVWLTTLRKSWCFLLYSKCCSIIVSYLLWAIWATTDNSLPSPVAPCGTRESSITSKTA